MAVLGVILSAAYLLVYYEHAFFGPVTREAVKTLPDLLPRETAIAAATCVMVLWIGFYPAPFLRITGGSVAALVERVRGSQATAMRLQNRN